jgi:hypothetical protein
LPPYGFAPPDFHLCDQKVTIISLAFSIGPRLAEIVGLDVGDVFLPDRLVAKLKRFWRWKRERGEDLSPAAPLFASALTGSTRCGTRRSRTSSGQAGTCSWRRDS